MKNAQQHILTTAALLVAAGAACGQVSPGAFASDAVEDYEGTPGGRTTLTSIFGGSAPVVPGSAQHDSCYADFDGDGVVWIFDYLAWAAAYSMGDLRADCDEDGGLDFFDFLCFMAEFEAGC